MRRVSSGTGEKTPIPPVLGPVSPSPTCLWSITGSRIRIVSPSVMASTDASSPTRHSSMTILVPAAPSVFFSMNASTAAHPDFASWQMMTPLPAASPSAFTTCGHDVHDSR
jgi:hypothetical protein